MDRANWGDAAGALVTAAAVTAALVVGPAYVAGPALGGLVLAGTGVGWGLMLVLHRVADRG